MLLIAICKGFCVQFKMQRPCRPKCGLIMKMLFVLLFAFSVQVNAKTYAQITLSEKDISLDKLFLKIHDQTGYLFLFNDNWLRQTKKVDIDVKNASLKQVLDICFSNQPLGFSIVDSIIVIKQLERSSSSKQAEDHIPPLLTVKGRVVDEKGVPQGGITVSLKGTARAVSTKDDGTFELAGVPENAVLVFTSVGFETYSARLTTSNPFLNITLRYKSSNLQDVVVIGYGTARRADLTGSIETLKGSDLTKGNPTNIVSGMQGKIAGTVITQSDGAPGAGLNIQIRGANSFLGGTQPLFVIDGIPYVNANSDATPSTISGSGEQSTVNALAFLNPADIESIEILKDASATAIYGSRGANGVVIITTKKGRPGGDKVEADFNTGISKVIKEIKVLDAYGYASMQNEGVSNANYFEPGPTPRSLPYPGNWQPSSTNPDSMVYYKGPADYIGHSTDWQKEIFQTGIVNNYTLNFSGANDNGNYLISGNYIDQKGVIAFSKYRQYGIRFNITRNVKKWLVVGSNTNFMQSRNQLVKTNNENLDGGVGVVKAALAFAPTLPLYDSGTNNFTAATQVSNPYVYVKDVKNQVSISQIFSANYLEATLAKGLKFRQNIGISYFNNQREQYFPRTVYEGLAAKGLAYQAQGWYTSLTSESILTYLKKINQHLITITGGMTYENNESNTKYQQASNFVNDLLQDNNMAGGQSYTQPQTNKTKSNLVSFLGRINESYQDKYLLTISFRADGTSKFAKQNRWSYFPSAAFAWKFSNEKFMNGLQSVINDAKLRVSYGRTGNQAVSPYQTLSKLIPFPYTFNGALASGYADDVYAGPGNKNLKWETTDQFDAGLDLSFLQNRISFHGDIYYKKTHDLLQNVSIPPTTGFSTQLMNRGSIENKGLELTVAALPLRNNSFTWNVSANISFNRNKILSLGDDVTEQFATRINTNGDQPFIQRPGLPIGAVYGYVESGIYRNEAEVRADPVMAAQPDAIIKRTVGEIRYKDINGDGAITAADRTIIGDVNPKFTYGFSNDFTYRNFNLNVLIQGVYGNQILNMNTYFLSNIGGFNNVPQYVYDGRWTFDNWENAQGPKAEQQYWRKFQFTSRYLENGSYIRLKNVSLGYNVKTSFVQTLRVYVSCANLVTITKYKGYDPDINGYGDDPARRGVDMGGYPGSRVLNFGIQCIF